MTKSKKILFIVMPIVSVLLNIFGILNLLFASNIAPTAIVGYLANVRLIARYVIVVIIMASGIMLGSFWASILPGRARNILSIAICTYSTILTIPLFLTFVLSFAVMNGTSIELVNPITYELMDIFSTKAWQYTIFAGGTIMGAIFLAVPIAMTVQTVKKPLIKY